MPYTEGSNLTFVCGHGRREGQRKGTAAKRNAVRRKAGWQQKDGISSSGRTGTLGPLRAPKGPGVMAEANRMAEAAEGTRRKGLDDGRDGRGGTGWQKRKKGPDGRGGRDRMARQKGKKGNVPRSKECSGRDGWQKQRRKGPDGRWQRRKGPDG